LLHFLLAAAVSESSDDNRSGKSTKPNANVIPVQISLFPILPFDYFILYCINGFCFTSLVDAGFHLVTPTEQKKLALGGCSITTAVGELTFCFHL
jgi:hypothetical protein